MNPPIPFHQWLEANKKDVIVGWEEYIDGMGIVECFETLDMLPAEARFLGSTRSKEAFMDFARQSYEDYRNFSNSAL